MFRQSIVCVALAAVSLVGCGRSDLSGDMLAAANSENVERLSSLYLAFHARNNFRGPRDMEEFRGFIQKLRPQILERVGVDPNNIDAVFVSERDGEPFRIRFGVPGSPMGVGAPVVFESAGEGGQMMVGFLDMTERLVDEGEAQSLWASRELNVGR